MNAFCFFLIKIFIKEKANKKPMHSRILLGRQTMPMHGKSLNHLMLLDQIQMKSSPKLYPTMGCQVITKRHLFYHYFTKVCLFLFYSMQCKCNFHCNLLFLQDKKSYEEYRKRVKSKLRWDKEGLGPNKTMSAWKYTHEGLSIF